MKHSLSYYITLLVLKLKGIKKDFSKSPVDYKKIRKEDVHSPKGNFFKQNTLNNFSVLETKITEVGLNRNSKKLIIFIHGGAFISGPAQHHWDTVKTIAKQSEYKIWMCDYPKAPEHKIKDISQNIDLVYKSALEKFPSKEIILIGDSVGGLLIASLVQRLIKNKIDLPKKNILVSPVMDASMSNPKINEFEHIDPMLSKKGVLSAKTLCAAEIDLKNSIISPLYGDFHNFPSTSLLLAEHDITYPDQQLTVEKMKNSKVDLEVITGKEMPHIWPFLPVMKEAKLALNKLIQIINKN